MKKAYYFFLLFYSLSALFNYSNAQSPSACNQWVNIHTSGTVTSTPISGGITYNISAYPWDSVELVGCSYNCMNSSGSWFGPAGWSAVLLSCPSVSCHLNVTQSGTYNFMAEWPVNNTYIVTFLQPTGLTETDDNIMQVYPNPAQNELSLNCTFKEMDYSVIDLNGKIKMNGKMLSSNKKLDIDKLSAGKYTLIIKSDNKLYTKEFMKL
jgi:hypothetical protein